MQNLKSTKKVEIKKEIARRKLARINFKAFLLLKWERFNQKPFLDNWHYDYLCKILESTLPTKQTSIHHTEQSEAPTSLRDNYPSSLRGFEKAEAIHNHNIDYHENPCGFSRNDEMDCHDLQSKFCNDKVANYKQIKRLMLNMPPSYGKTEIIARSFIAWALGNDRSRKIRQYNQNIPTQEYKTTYDYKKCYTRLY